VYPSLLRRTHLNVFGNVSRRMNVVMQASTLARDVELDTEEIINLPLVPKNKPKGKLAAKLIDKMAKENVSRADIESV